MNKLLTSHEQVPTAVIIWLETGKTTIPVVWWGGVPTAMIIRQNYYSGLCVGCRVQGVGCMLVPPVVRIRLSQPPAGDWLAGAGAELGNNLLSNSPPNLKSTAVV